MVILVVEKTSVALEDHDGDVVDLRLRSAEAIDRVYEGILSQLGGLSFLGLEYGEHVSLAKKLALLILGIQNPIGIQQQRATRGNLD